MSILISYGNTSDKQECNLIKEMQIFISSWTNIGTFLHFHENRIIFLHVKISCFRLGWVRRACRQPKLCNRHDTVDDMVSTTAIVCRQSWRRRSSMSPVIGDKTGNSNYWGPANQVRGNCAGLQEHWSSRRDKSNFLCQLWHLHATVCTFNLQLCQSDDMHQKFNRWTQPELHAKLCCLKMELFLVVFFHHIVLPN